MACCRSSEASRRKVSLRKGVSKKASPISE